MNILIINGSPKGKYSITLQTLRFLEKKNPNHTFSILNAGQTIRGIEKDFSKSRQMLLDADAIIFSYPVYTFVAPCQLHRFIELLKADGVDISGKFATQITTSKHFYDITAHKYIEDNCRDLGLKYVKGLSADMDDLLTEVLPKSSLTTSFGLWKMVCTSFIPSLDPPIFKSRRQTLLMWIKKVERILSSLPTILMRILTSLG